MSAKVSQTFPDQRRTGVTTTAVPDTPPRWTTIVLGLIAAFNVPTGLWAVLSPEGWYDNFPGYAPQLISAYPPYNQHLAVDAGAGLLSIGVLAAAAAFLGRRDAHLAAGAGLFAFTGPHALFHVLNPSDLLTSSENASSTIPLVITAFASLAIMIRAVTSNAEVA